MPVLMQPGKLIPAQFLGIHDHLLIVLKKGDIKSFPVYTQKNTIALLRSIADHHILQTFLAAHASCHTTHDTEKDQQGHQSRSHPLFYPAGAPHIHADSE